MDEVRIYNRVLSESEIQQLAIQEPVIMNNNCSPVNYSLSDKELTFNTLAMELFNPITDKPTGKFALYTGDNLVLKSFSGFNDFKYVRSDITYTEQVIEASENCHPTYSTREGTVYFPKIEVPLVSVLPNGSLVNGDSICYEAYFKRSNTQKLVFTLTEETNEISCE